MMLTVQIMIDDIIRHNIYVITAKDGGTGSTDSATQSYLQGFGQLDHTISLTALTPTALSANNKSLCIHAP